MSGALPIQVWRLRVIHDSTSAIESNDSLPGISFTAIRLARKAVVEFTNELLQIVL